MIFECVLLKNKFYLNFHKMIHIVTFAGVCVVYYMTCSTHMT